MGPDPNDKEHLMTLSELATYLNVSERTIYGWAQRNVIPAFKLGASWRFRLGEIDAWLETQRSGPVLGQLGIRCSVCSRSFTHNMRLGEKCESPDCQNPVCETCRGSLGRRYCPAHHSGSYGVGGAGSGDADRARAIDQPGAGLVDIETIWDRFLDGFAHRVEGRPYLLGTGGEAIAQVGDWRRVKTTSASRSGRTRTTTNRSVRRGSSGLRAERWVAYRIPVPAGTLSATPRHIRLEARCIAPVTQGERSRRAGAAPVTLEDLGNLLTEARSLAQEEDVLYVLGVYSSQGWSDEAKRLFDGGQVQGFLNPNLSVSILGGSLSEIYWNSNDTVLNEIGFYFRDAFDDEVAQCKDHIRETMADFDVYLVKEIIERGEFTPAVARTAIDSLVVASEIETSSEYRDEVLLKKEE